ncbi:hypothetical protein HK096_006535 [Nowakowskiella sp. JEL0078]|nr:hypothetical protein HK096_006535 [Nowakowskiella sp. JEL0078]
MQIFNYTNTKEPFIEVGMNNYNSTYGETVNIEVGKVTEESSTDSNKLYIAGWVWGISQRWFMTYDEDDLKVVDSINPIFSITETGGTAEASWIYNSDKDTVTGVKVTCNTPTASQPSCYIVEFEWISESGPKFSSKKEISRPNFGEKRNSTPYAIPPPSRKGPSIIIPKKRERETFESWTLNGSGLRLKLKSTEQNHTGRNWDIFTAYFVVVNPLDHPVGLLDSSSFWRFRDPALSELNGGTGGEWTASTETGCQSVPADERNYRDYKPLPQQVPAFGTILLKMDCSIENPYAGDIAPVGRSAWMNRLGPIVVDFALEDLDGGVFGNTVEFLWNGTDANVVKVHDPSYNKDVIKFISCDEPLSLARRVVTINKPSSPPKSETGSMLNLSVQSYSYEVSVHNCRMAVSRGRTIAAQGGVDKDGSTATCVNVSYEDWSNKDGTSKLYMLVDHSLNRVYALKVIITTKTSNVEYVHEIEPYGDAVAEDAADTGEPATDAKEARVPDGFEAVNMESFDATQKRAWESGTVFPDASIEQKKVVFEPRVKSEVRKVAAGGSKVAGGGGIGSEELEEIVRKVVKEELTDVMKRFIENQEASFEKIVKGIEVSAMGLEAVAISVERQGLSTEKFMKGIEASAKGLEAVAVAVENRSEHVEKKVTVKSSSSDEVPVLQEQVKQVIQHELQPLKATLARLGRLLVGGSW